MSKGKLILVSGLTGSGKTTLARAIVDQLPNFEYLQTVTSRPRRDTEQDVIEYDFVSSETYITRMRASANWDHNEIHGNYYGADVDDWNQKTRAGMNLICTIAPDMERVQQTRDLYEAEVKTIWLDVPADVVRSRVAHDPKRSNRIEDESVKAQFDYTFRPIGDLEEDKRAFTQFVAGLL